jgi:hypothetical protein
MLLLLESPIEIKALRLAPIALNRSPNRVATRVFVQSRRIKECRLTRRTCVELVTWSSFIEYEQTIETQLESPTVESKILHLLLVLLDVIQHLVLILELLGHCFGSAVARSRKRFDIFRGQFD